MNAEDLIKDGERIDDLQREGLKIIQDPGGFCFGMDAVLLADFCRATSKSRMADLGTGTGILPLLTWSRYRYFHMDAVEIQPLCADRAHRSVLMNGLESRIRVINGDIRQIRELLPHDSYDVVLCNPPYSRADAALPACDRERFLARQDSECTLDDIAAAASWLLRDRGHFFVVLPAFRLTELIQALLKHRLQPKKLRFVYSSADSSARLLLMDAMYNANPGIEILPPLVTHTANGTVTDEVKRIYGDL